MKSLFCLLLLAIFCGATRVNAARIELKPATPATAAALHLSPEVRPARQFEFPVALQPAGSIGTGSALQPAGSIGTGSALQPLIPGDNRLSSPPGALAGKSYSFKERLVIKYLRRHLKKMGMREGEPVDPRRLKQGRLALILGAGAFVVAFIPVVQILSPLMAIAAIALGVISLQGNSNLPGILGICFGGAFLLLILLVVAIFVLTFSFW